MVQAHASAWAKEGTREVVWFCPFLGGDLCVNPPPFFVIIAEQKRFLQLRMVADGSNILQIVKKSDTKKGKEVFGKRGQTKKYMEKQGLEYCIARRPNWHEY